MAKRMCNGARSATPSKNGIRKPLRTKGTKGQFYLSRNTDCNSRLPQSVFAELSALDGKCFGAESWSADDFLTESEKSGSRNVHWKPHACRASMSTRQLPRASPARSPTCSSGSNFHCNRSLFPATGFPPGGVTGPYPTKKERAKTHRSPRTDRKKHTGSNRISISA